MMYRNFLRTLATASLCCVMLMPVDVMAKNNKPKTEHSRSNNNRGNNGNRPGASGNHNNRPGNSSAVNRPGNNGNHKHDNGAVNRPGNNSNHKPDNGAVNRPGNNGNHKPDNGAMNRPGNNGNHKPDNGAMNRPGNNGNHKPDNGAMNRPGNNGNHKPDNGAMNRPGNNGNHNGWYKPGNPHNQPTRPGTSHMAPPPARPHRPVYTPWHRPVPPPASWRPYRNAPSLGTILGITIGTALANSIDHLINAGYYVDGYQDGAVYLRDVNQMNLMWPDAVLFYDNGYLAGSEYNYSTPYSNPARYSSVYNSLYRTYGPPVATISPSAGVTLSTWYTPGNGYISLQYGPTLTGGAYRYYTTLRVGRY